MAIINRPQSEREQKEEAPRRGIISGPAIEAAPKPNSASTNPDEVKRSSLPWGVLTGIGVLLLGVMVVLNLDFSSDNSESNQAADIAQVSAESLNLQVDKLVRIAGLASLTKKKVEQNRHAFEMAKQHGDQIIIDTMKLALAQNLKDLQEYQTAQVAQLAELHRYYSSNPGPVESQFKLRLKASDDAFKLGNASAIQEALTLMKSVPEGMDPKTFFKEQI